YTGLAGAGCPNEFTSEDLLPQHCRGGGGLWIRGLPPNAPQHDRQNSENEESKEGDAHTQLPIRRSSRALLSKRSAKSRRSCVSASSCWRSWTSRSTASSRAVTSADGDWRREARKRAILITVKAGIPTNIRSAARNTAGCKGLFL